MEVAGIDPDGANGAGAVSLRGPDRVSDPVRNLESVDQQRGTRVAGDECVKGSGFVTLGQDEAVAIVPVVGMPWRRPASTDEVASKPAM